MLTKTDSVIWFYICLLTFEILKPKPETFSIMKALKILPLIVILSFVLFPACEDKGSAEPETLIIAILDPTDKSETGFIAHWSVNRSNIESAMIEFARTKDFSDIIKQVVVNDPQKSSQSVDGLQGATKYYYRLVVNLDDGTSGQSQSESVVMAYQSESANVVTLDDVHIAGDIYYLNSNPAKSPAMILMGHFSVPNMWKGEDIFLDLVAQGYICYVFNYRGHAASGEWDILSITEVDELAEFVSVHARNDLHACYSYLKEHDKVDASSIGLMGGSLGANLSMIGNNWTGVKVSVGLSTSRLGIEEGGLLHNVFLIAADQDCNSFVCFDEEAEFLYNGAVEPKKMTIISGDFHGLDMFVETDLNNEVLDWINERMGI